jgi:hypothetical protein
MEYVMVPVPEELVADVEKFLVMNAVRPGAKVLDPEAVEQLWTTLSAAARELLLRAAEAAREHLLFTVQDAAVAVRCSEHELLGRVVELNNLVKAAGGPRLTLVPMLDDISESDSRVWPLTMARDVADLFLQIAGRVSAAEES